MKNNNKIINLPTQDFISTTVAYAYLFNLSSTNSQTIIQPGQQIIFNNNNINPLVNNTIYNDIDGSITFKVSGVYKGTFNVIGVPETTDILSFKLIKISPSGFITIVPQSIFSTSVQNNIANLTGNVTFSVQAGDKIKLISNTSSNVILSTGSITNSISDPIQIGNHNITTQPIINPPDFSSFPLLVKSGSSIYVLIELGNLLENTEKLIVTDNLGNIYQNIATDNIITNENQLSSSIFYKDNVVPIGQTAENIIITVRVFASANTGIIQVIEVMNTANPSFDDQCDNYYFSDNPNLIGEKTSITGIPFHYNDGLALAAFTIQNKNTMQSFQPGTENQECIIIDSTSPTSNTYSIGGAATYKLLSTPGLYNLGIISTTSQLWTSAAVSIKPATSSMIIKNASLNIYLLRSMNMNNLYL